MKVACAFLAVFAVSGTVVKKSEFDINQKVYIENADAPAVKVCGTGIKVEFFMRNRCEKYYEHQVTVGKCDTGMSSDTCDEFSPSHDPRFGAYQSYLVTDC